MLQHGAYTLLMDSCYDREQFPTLEQAIDWVWASTTDEVEAVKFVLNKFFECSEGVYVQKRIQDDLCSYHKNSDTNKRIAIERERKRKEKSTKRAQLVNEAPQGDNESPPNHKPLTINQEPITNKKDLSSKNDMTVIFEYWIEVMNKNKSTTKLTAARSKSINGRLKDGYTVEQIKQGIVGCSLTPFNMGKNENNKTYNDIELICRTGDKLENYMTQGKQDSNPFGTGFSGYGEDRVCNYDEL